MLTLRRPLFPLRAWCLGLAAVVLWAAAGLAAEGSRAAALQEQARQLHRAGQYKEALPLALQALQSHYLEKGLEHPDTAASLTLAGLLYLELDALNEALPLLQRALQIRFKALGVDHADTAASLAYLGEVYRRQGALEDARPLLQRSLQIREKVNGPDHPDTAQSLVALALYHQDCGEEGQALALLTRALAIREKLLGHNSPDLAASLNLVGDYQRSRGAYQQALPLLERSQQINDRSLGRLHPATAQSLRSLGLLYLEMGFYSKAQAALEHALQVRQKALGLEHPLAVQSLSDLGLLYTRQKEFDKAKPLLDRALAIRERRRPPDHPDLAASYNDLAVFYQTLGQLDQAQGLAQRALQIREQVLGPNHPQTLASLQTLAAIYRDIPAQAKAVPLYLRLVKAREKAFGPDHLDLIPPLLTLAQVQKEAGQYDQALATWQRLHANREKNLGETHPETLANLETLARLALELGIYSKAAAWSDKYLKTLEKLPNPPKPALAQALAQMGRVQMAMGEYDAALPWLEKAVKLQESGGGPDQPELAHLLLNLAELRQAQEEYDQASALVFRAVQLLAKAKGGDHPDTALALAQGAEVYEARGWYADALSLYRQSIQIFTKANANPELVQTLPRLAALLERMGEGEAALPLWSQAARLAEQTIGVSQTDIDQLVAALGLAYLRAGEWQKAETTWARLKNRLERVEVALLFGNFDEAWQLLEEAPPPLVTTPAFQVRWQTAKGRALAGLGLLPEAAVTLWEASQGAAKLALRGGQARSRVAARWQAVHPLEHLLMVLVRLEAQATPLPPQLQELGPTPRLAAFALAAVAKAQRFLAVLAQTPHSFTLAELPDELQHRLRVWQQRLAAQEKQWERAVRGSKEALQEAMATREKLMAAREVLQGEVALSHPLAAALLYPQPLAVSDVPLASDEVLIEYVLGEAAGFIIVMRGAAIEALHELPLGRAALAARIQDFLSGLQQVEPAAQPQEQARELYELLLAKPLAGVAPWERVIIVPDGVLSLLPFEALVMAIDPASQAPVHVGDKFPLVYYPSAAVLAQQRGRPAAAPPLAWLAVANPFFPPPVLGLAEPKGKENTKGEAREAPPPPQAWTPVYQALASHRSWGPVTPGPRRDQWLLYPPRPTIEPLLQDLARQWQSLSQTATVLLGNAAARSHWEAQGPQDYCCLHFATYTDFSQTVQGLLQPFILLGWARPPAPGDGLLTLQELLGRTWPVQLVVLDNGIIGRGQALANDGVALLCRGLFYAGARNVLVNLWPLEPATTFTFYQDFYTALQQGQSRQTAFLQARHRLRQNHPEPRIWAAWQLWGDGF